MKITHFGKSVSLALALCAGATLYGCGNETTDLTSDAPSAAALGGFTFDCENGSSSQQQSKQVPFQQQQTCTQPDNAQQQQTLKFTEQKLSDFEVQLDCSDRVVRVKNKGEDEEEKSLPIQSDGKVQGQLQYVQQIADDGKGNQNCWIEYRVNFDGKASCEANTSATPTSTPTTSPSPTASPSTSPSPTSTPTTMALAFLDDNSGTGNSAGTAGEQKLELTTTVEFAPTSTQALEQAGIEIEGGDQPGSTPTPSPSTSPSVSPTASPTTSASPTSTPTMTTTPTPTTTATVTPVKVCMVENPCPVVGKTEFSCGQQ